MLFRNSLEWKDYIGEDDVLLNMVKPYIYLKVRLLFDPPQTSYTQTAFENQLEQMEWRINVYRETLTPSPEEVAADG